MDKDLEHQLRQAIDRSRQWASDGWPVTFGDRGVVVSSLSEAQNLPLSAVCRMVALSYWQNVHQIGHEAATWGEKALRHLVDNDLRAVEAAVYYACYLERPLVRNTATWQPISSLLQRTLDISAALDE
ncbi:MAG: hypothetical protein F9K32_05830 [Desulfobulbaceae bacterium]|nr:MAG: hypothetical protein F9K32_05830 [Desulfobulbaceae bacterium]